MPVVTICQGCSQPTEQCLCSLDGAQAVETEPDFDPPPRTSAPDDNRIACALERIAAALERAFPPHVPAPRAMPAQASACDKAKAGKPVRGHCMDCDGALGPSA